jgi:hypothetical protein
MDWRAEGDDSSDDDDKPLVRPGAPALAASCAQPVPDMSEHHRAVLAWLDRMAPTVAATPSLDPSLHALFDLESRGELLSSRRVSAPGPDHLSVLFLRHGGEAVQRALLLLFNFSWSHGVVPLDWRSADVIALFKGKGLDPSVRGNYRPISLTSVVVRCMEGLVHARLYPAAERLGLLSPEQFGFRHGRSTQDAIFVLLEFIKELLCDPSARAVPVAFLDLTKAYDRTWQEGVLKRLADGGITGRAWAWIRAFLTRRRFRVVNGAACSEWQEVTASVPQGAVLSPLLFAIFLDPLVALCKRPEFQRPLADPSLASAAASPQLLFPVIRMALFADDVRMAPDTRLLGWQECFQRALHEAATFAATWRLSFSLDAGKSAIVWFRRPRMSLLRDPIRYPQRFVLCGQPLAVVEQYKYLGVWLHQSLSWQPHFQHLLKQARFAAFQTQRLLPRLLTVHSHGEEAADASSRALGGPHFSAVRALVLGGVYSRSTYGCMFLSGPHVDAWMRQLQSVIVRPLRQLLGLPRSAHIVSILVECDCPTLALYRHQLLLSYARRVQRMEAAHPASEVLQHSWSLLASLGQPVLAMVRGTWVPRLRDSGVDETRRPLLYDILEAERRCGLRVLDPPSGLHFPASPQASSHPVPSVARGRLSAAIIEGEARLAALLQRVVASQDSDSPPGAVVPAAAVLVQHAASSAPEVMPPQTTAPPKELSLSRLARLRSFQEWHAQTEGGALLRACKSKAGRSPYLYLEPRGVAVLRARLRFNRCHLRQSLHRRGLANSPLCTYPECRRSGAQETVEHALLHCPRLAEPRRRCEAQLRAKARLPLSLSLLLGEVPLRGSSFAGPIAGPASSSPAVPRPLSPPHPVFQSSRGGSRPRPHLPQPSQRRTQQLREAKALLFITHALLRALQACNGGVL